MVEKFIKNGEEVAVLVSHGFGAGWSTWAGDSCEFAAMDKTLVEMALRNATEAEVIEYWKSIFGDDNYVYTGGWSDVEVYWLPKGTAFYIDEYDGSESLVTGDSLYMVT